MTDTRICPHCGGRYVDERHVELCEASPFSGVDECPMCGEPYGSYTGHLQRCGGGAD